MLLIFAWQTGELDGWAPVVGTHMLSLLAAMFVIGAASGIYAPDQREFSICTPR